MNFAVIRQHRDFFRKHHWLECEGVFSEEETKRVAQGVAAALAARLKVKADALADMPPDKVFAAGHDLWRTDATLKKVLLHRNLAEIAGELTEQRPLRFGYDMLLPTAGGSSKFTGPYKTLMDTSPTLTEICSIQGIICGAMICVSGPTDKKSVVEKIDGTFLSDTPGNIIFFSPEWHLPFNEIINRPGYQYLMIVYVKPKSVYTRQDNDPHVHEFKQLGYQFGDKLTDILNPIVYQ